MKKGIFIVAMLLTGLGLHLPLFGQDLINQGKQKLQDKDYKTAITCFTKALVTQSTDAELFSLRATAKQLSGDRDGALNDLAQAIKLQPAQADFYGQRGLLKAEIKDFTGALQDYDEAIRFDAQNPLYYYHRASVKFELEDHLGAMEDSKMYTTLTHSK
jgi:tetratricopeptide (TPR) repeat protein